MQALNALIVFNLIAIALASISTKCLVRQVAHEWEFTLGQASRHRSSCGHHLPDDLTREPPISLGKVGGRLTASNGSPVPRKRIRLGSLGNASTEKDSSGSWTMVANEGFEVNAEGLSFFAFFKFNGSSANGKEVTGVNCSETMLGWYRNADRTKFGCYFAKMIDKGIDSKKDHPVGKPVMVSPKQASPHRSFLQSVSREQSLTFDQHKEIVEKVNAAQNSWTATVYDHMIGKSLLQLSKGKSLSQLSKVTDRQEQRQALPIQPSFMSSGLRRGQKRSPQLPKEVDWRNVNGRSFLDPVVDQQECASSYTVSTIRMLSARHRIKRNDSSLAPFSITFPLFCTEYNQGCNGGDAFLAAKWSSDVGLVPDACDMYNPWGSCEIDHSCVKKSLGFRADNHRYIGGIFGAMPDPDELMQELYEKGPLVVSINHEPSFMYYKSGIYTSVPMSDTADEDIMDTQDVLLVGYGEEHGQKYWIAQNSFGDKWGEQGFFRVARGRNEAGIESVGVAADVVKDLQTGVLSSFAGSIGEALQMVHPH